MTDFKAGDRVRRIGRGNGKHSACVGALLSFTEDTVEENDDE